MKCDQIAYYVHSDEQAEIAAKMLGLGPSGWVEDDVTGLVRFSADGEWQHSKAHLMFHYGHGTEIELLRYLEGDHWHARNTAGYHSGLPFLSHIGYHITPADIDGDKWPLHLSDGLLVQEMKTTAHTNPFLIENGRRYHYRIYDTRRWLGVYTKFIKRIEKGEQ